jgi:hypothetical protein
MTVGRVGYAVVMRIRFEEDLSPWRTWVVKWVLRVLRVVGHATVSSVETQDPDGDAVYVAVYMRPRTAAEAPRGS